MAQTTTTTLAYDLPTELIAANALLEARPFNTVAPLVRNAVQPLKTGKVWQQSKLPTTSASSVAEGSDITAGARTTTRAYATMAEVGLSSTLTLFAQETIASDAAEVQTWVNSHYRAIAQKITGDLCALFTDLNGGTDVGSTTVDITVANFIEAIYTLEAANAPGQKRCVLHPRQVADLWNAIDSTGTIYSNLPELVREGRLPNGQPSAGFAGFLFGVPIYQTTEVDTANSAEDRCGAMFTPDAMAFVQLRAPMTQYDSDKSKREVEIITTAAYGVTEVVDAYGVPITTDA